MLIRVVDVESTGLAPPEHTVCEIGWADLRETEDHAGDWQVVATGELLCHPGRTIPPEVSAIHHIVDGDVAGAKPWHHAVAEVCGPTGLFSVDALCAHNARFERQWISDTVTKGAPWICTFKCALRLWPDAPSHSNQVLRYWRNPEGLDRAIASVAHRAMPDAYVTAFLLRDMLREASMADLIKWSAEPAILPKIQFGKYKGKRFDEVDGGFLSWLLDKDFDEDVKFTARHELNRRKQMARA